MHNREQDPSPCHAPELVMSAESLTTDSVNAFLVRFSDAVLEVTDPYDVARLACELVAEILDVERSYWADVDWATREYVIGAAVHQSGVPVIEGRFPIDAWEPFSSDHLAGRPVVVDDTQADERISPEIKAAYAHIAVGADLVTSIVINKRLRCILAVNQQRPRHWTEEEIALVRGIATRCWTSVERARTEAALRESEARYRALATASADVIYRMSADWREMQHLDEGRGVLADMLKPSSTWVETYLLPEDRPRVAAVIAEAVRTGASFELEHRVRQADGSVGWTHSRAVPIRDETGTVVEWIGTASDITARKQAAEHLRQSEEHYQRLFAAMDQGFCTIEVCFDASGHAVDYEVLETNPAFERVTGLREVVGRRMREIAPTHEDYWYEIYGQVARTGEPRRFEAAAAALGRWYNVYAYRVGRPDAHRVAVLFEDVTARRQAEATLRVIQEHQAFLLKLSDAVRKMADPVEIMATVSEHVGRYLDVERCGYAEIPPPYDRLVVARDWTNGAMDSLQGTWPLAMSGATLISSHRSGQTLVVHDVYADERLHGSEAGAEVAGGVRSAIAVQLLKGGHWAATLYVQNTSVRHWTPGEVTLVEEIAERTWAAVERARAERRLQESEERYRRIVDQATDYAIFSTDARRRIETWPPGAAKVFGWSAEEAVGQLVDITYLPEDRAAEVPVQEFARARETGHAPNVRWHVRKDGSLVFIEGDTYARRTENGAFQGVFKIGQDITDRLAAEDARREEEAVRREELEVQVQAATSELRTLSRRLLAVQEEERRKLALELHDEVGQVLTGLTFQLAAARGMTGLQALNEAQTTVHALTELVRQMALDLRPQVLDRYGLLAALEWHIARFQAKTGITVNLRQQGLDRRFAPEVEIAAFRVVQEALTNVARHSGADFATVQLYGDGALTLVIRDAGRGFDPARRTDSSGLGGMRERVELLGGALVIEATPGGGTVVIAELPAEFSGDDAP